MSFRVEINQGFIGRKGDEQAVALACGSPCAVQLVYYPSWLHSEVPVDKDVTTDNCQLLT